jgi:FKBP-type peptidyl-prolyl cis-trans isomerase
VASTVVGPLSVAAFLELLAGDIVLLDADDDRAAAAMQSDVYLWNGAIGAPLPSASGGNTPERGDVVRIHYDAWLADAQDGAPFDSSRSAVGADGVGVPFEFEVGTARVIAGLERTVRRMRAGDACRVFVPSALAYGSAGSGGGVVPPYADLVFAVELISVTPFKLEPAVGAGRVEIAASMSL